MIVRPGDSLDRIAQAYYGTTIKADAIYEANKEVIGEIRQELQPWMILTLPGLELLVRDEHEVEEGETLSSIAQECYGDSTRWPDIQFVNRHVLGDTIEEPRRSQVLILYECRG
jgi:nucleoid-associated protein YgaU